MVFAGLFEDSCGVFSLWYGPSGGVELSQSLPMMSVVRISYSLPPGMGLSWLRSGLLVWTGVEGPDMSDGVEQAALASLGTLLKEPWVMWSLQPTLSPELRRPSVCDSELYDWCWESAK